MELRLGDSTLNPKQEVWGRLYHPCSWPHRQDGTFWHSFLSLITTHKSGLLALQPENGSKSGRFSLLFSDCPTYRSADLVSADAEDEEWTEVPTELAEVHIQTLPTCHRLVVHSEGTEGSCTQNDPIKHMRKTCT